MKLDTFYQSVDLYRKEKILYAQFLKPHRSLSTSRINGGVQENLDFLINHQCCEPRKHTGNDLSEVITQDPERYIKRITSKAGISHERAALLNTAANMNNAAISRAQYADLEVVAVCTAGVGSNAGRAGDPASYHASSKGYEKCGTNMPKAGTIITMIFINQELSSGALVSAVTVATEAKSAVLQELTARSCYSEGIATGTGTDQIGIAAKIGGDYCHSDANKHSKLGELIGLATRGALKQALNLQCGMTADSRRSSLLQLERFGETEASFTEAIASELPEDLKELFRNNFLSVNHDPVTVAALQACVHIKDQFVWGVLPHTCANETLLNQAALIARAVSGKATTPDIFLNDWKTEELANSSTEFLKLIHQAFARGFSIKWQNRFND